MLPSAPLLVYAGTQEHEKVAQRIRGRSIAERCCPAVIHACLSVHCSTILN
jgi:hypothetical protein